MFTIFQFDTLASTNDYVKENYTQLKNKSVIWAKKQTKGRGRFLRIWESEEDLTFSILFTSFFPHAMLAPLSVVMALEQFHIKSEIKWPNDILIDGKKVCGILIEQLYEGMQCEAMVVGIGINTSYKDVQLKYATWVDLPREELLTAVLKAYEQLLELSKEEILQMYQKYHVLKGKRIKLKERLWTIGDVNKEGYLTIYGNEEIRYLKSEEISLSHLYMESDEGGNHWCRL